MSHTSRRLPYTRPRQVEWPTLGLMAVCLGLIGISVFGLAGVSLWLAMPVLIVGLTLHSSLTHEVLHGHPFPARRLSEALVVISVLCLGIVYRHVAMCRRVEHASQAMRH